jgi:hypothetical protein
MELENVNMLNFSLIAISSACSRGWKYRVENGVEFYNFSQNVSFSRCSGMFFEGLRFKVDE